jgi:ABC-type glycerol-3-phosphate transport system permease component
MDKYVILDIIKRFFIYLVLVVLTLIAIVPIWIMIVNATRSVEEINSGLSFLPSTNVIYNWNKLSSVGKLAKISVVRAFGNSLFLALATTVVTVYFSALTAYGLKIYNFKGRDFLFAFIVFVITIPPQLGMIGFYKFMSQIKLLNTYIPLIIPAIAAPNTVFFMKQYMESVLQKELIDAARIDGANEIAIFHSIIVPIIAPSLATMAIFAFVGTWNSFVMPYILISSNKLLTLPMFVNLLRTDIYRTEFGSIYLGIAISVIPIIVFYLFMSKYIISGLTLGGVKEIGPLFVNRARR